MMPVSWQYALKSSLVYLPPLSTRRVTTRLQLACQPYPASTSTSRFPISFPLGFYSAARVRAPHPLAVSQCLFSSLTRVDIVGRSGSRSRRGERCFWAGAVNRRPRDQGVVAGVNCAFDRVAVGKFETASSSGPVVPSTALVVCDRGCDKRAGKG